jgi:hypothetical protein
MYSLPEYYPTLILNCHIGLDDLGGERINWMLVVVITMMQGKCRIEFVRCICLQNRLFLL